MTPPKSLWWVTGTVTLTVRVRLRGAEVTAASEAEAIETAIEQCGFDGDVVSHTLTATSLAPKPEPAVDTSPLPPFGGKA